MQAPCSLLSLSYLPEGTYAQDCFSTFLSVLRSALLWQGDIGFKKGAERLLYESISWCCIFESLVESSVQSPGFGLILAGRVSGQEMPAPLSVLQCTEFLSFQRTCQLQLPNWFSGIHSQRPLALVIPSHVSFYTPFISDSLFSILPGFFSN